MRLAIALLCLSVVGCGGDSPTAPTPTTTTTVAPVARATVVLDSWNTSACLAPFGLLTCRVSITVRNQGPDCAGAIRATLHIRTESGAAVRDVAFDLGAVTLRAGEPFTMTTTGSQDLGARTSASDLRGTLEAFATPTFCS